LGSGDYDEDNIYVKLVPYDVNSLSALLLFWIEESMKADISVLGSYANKENEVIFSVE